MYSKLSKKKKEELDTYIFMVLFIILITLIFYSLPSKVTL